jgi:predicted PurR-regulated permease PerM
MSNNDREVPMVVRSIALTVVAVFAGLVILQDARSVLIPIVLAILISYALSPMVASLTRHRVPRAAASMVAVLVLVGTIGAGVWSFSDDVFAIVDSVPQTAQRIRERVRAARRQTSGTFQRVQEAATQLEQTAKEAQGTSEPARGVQKVEIVEPPFRASDYLWLGGVGLFGILGQFSMILFLVFFLLVSDDLFKKKLVKIAGPTMTKKKVTVQILDEINRQIESFLKVQIITNVVVGVATGAALCAFGVNNYVVWGLFAGIFNSVPYLGPVIVTAGLGVVTFAQFDDLTKSLYVAAATLAITSLEGYLLAPALMGRAARMNPVAIFIGLLFWTWIWGVWGTVLAVPMLMMVKAICDHVEDLQPIGELLGE